jgi:hypothetical protein
VNLKDIVMSVINMSNVVGHMVFLNVMPCIATEDSIVTVIKTQMSPCNVTIPDQQYMQMEGMLLSQEPS